MFVRYVSHEIRTPLNTVFLGLKVLKQEIKDMPTWSPAMTVNQTLEDIETSCNNSLEILNDLLLYDKIESGLQGLDCLDVNLREVMRETIRSFEIQARAAGIECSFIDASLPFRNGDNALDQSGGSSSSSSPLLCNVDPFKIKQVVRNLLSNALKFTAPGGRVTVTLSLQDTPDTKLQLQDMTGSTSTIFMRRLSAYKIYCSDEIANANTEVTRSRGIVITVQDTGHGISEENQQKLFKNIIQFSPGTLQSGQGTGLGLFISHGIMKLHGGDLTVTSAGLGCGSTFIATLPFSPPRSTGSGHAMDPPPHIDGGAASGTAAPAKLEPKLNRNTPNEHSPAAAATKGKLDSAHSIENNNIIFRNNFLNDEVEVESDTSNANSVHVKYDNNNENEHYRNNNNNITHTSSNDDNNYNNITVSNKCVSCKTATIINSNNNSDNMNRFANVDDPPTNTSLPTPLSKPEIDIMGRKRRRYSSFVDTVTLDGGVPPTTATTTRNSTGTLTIAIREHRVTAFLARQNVLVVDDAPLNRKMLTRLLVSRCRSVHEAEDGEAAILAYKQSVLSEEEMDVILMDYQMPKLDGPSAASALRGLGFTGLIIGVTGNAVQNDIDTFVNRGANFVMAKPLNLDALEEKIYSYIVHE